MSKKGNKKVNCNLPSIFEYRVADIDYLVPELFRGGAKRELTSIKNAMDGGFGDKRGSIFINSKYLDRVLRTKTFVAKEILVEINSDEKVECDGQVFIRLGELMKLITKRLEKLPSGKTRRYLLLVEEFLINIRDSDKFVNIRNEIEADYKQEINKLKTRKKAQIKREQLKVGKFKGFYDELTGEKLVRYSQFSHIRAKSVYPSLALNINNGLLVNEGTHSLITSLGIIEEEGLLKLCKQKGWRTSWYKIFKAFVV
ncbi:MAG: hypothetical protein ACRCTZ_03045 [Sarcina sp.]